MYCSNCKCDSCQAQRLAGETNNGVLKDVVRLVIKSGDKGMTMAEMKEFSRPFRAIGKEGQALLLDRLEAEGKLIKHRFSAQGRGRFRMAYLAAEISQ